MKQAVQDIWMDFNRPLEGVVGWMYLDIKALVTTGMGNLIDSHADAEALPWKSSTADFADPSDQVVDAGTIDDAWDTVKARTDLAPGGGGAFKSLTQIRLSQDDVQAAVLQKLAQMESFLKTDPATGFPGFDDFPADAQLGILSMAWGMGPAFGGKFPKFRGFANDQNWAQAAGECRFQPDIGTIVIRNNNDQALFRNAQAVVEQGLDPEQLVWPNTL